MSRCSKSWFAAAPIVAVIALAAVFVESAWTSTAGGTAAAAEPTLTAHDVMVVVNKGKAGLFAGTQALLEEPDDEAWERALAQANVMLFLSKEMTKSKPRKGEVASWKAQCKKYTENLTKLAAAIKSKKKSAAKAQAGVVRKSCGGCHRPHK